MKKCPLSKDEERLKKTMENLSPAVHAAVKTEISTNEKVLEISKKKILILEKESQIVNILRKKKAVDALERYCAQLNKHLFKHPDKKFSYTLSMFETVRLVKFLKNLEEITSTEVSPFLKQLSLIEITKLLYNRNAINSDSLEGTEGKLNTTKFLVIVRWEFTEDAKLSKKTLMMLSYVILLKTLFLS